MAKPAWWHLLDRVYKMFEQSGYRVMEHNPDQNDPIGAWMSDARILLRTVPEQGEALTENDKRWRLLEHGCQWVSWTPIGGETHSFDPRSLQQLKLMRTLADETIAKQLATLEEGRKAIEAMFTRGGKPNV